jgi:hypothetical protein
LAELADQRVGDRVDPLGVARLSLGRLMLALELLSLTFRPQ